MSTGRYQSYNALVSSGEQWLGDVPSKWKAVRLKTLFQIRKQIAGKLGFDVLSVTQRGVKLKDLTSGEGQLSMDYSKYQLVNRGDFVMNHMDLLTGFVDISPFPGVTSPDYRVFIPRPGTEMHTRFYLYIFQMCYLNKIFFPLGQGSAQLGRWRLPRQEFEEFILPVPTVEEQTQIARFLDYETAKIDALIEKQQQLIALLKEKRQAVISHAVTKGLDPSAPMKDSGVEWLGKVPAHWDIAPIKRVFENLDFRRIPLSTTERGERRGQYDYYGASGVIDHIDEYLFDEPTILVGEDGANLLNRSTPLAFPAFGKYWVNNHAHILRPPDVAIRFWSEAIEHIDVSPLVTGSAQPKLTAEALMNLKVAFPPDLDERISIDKFITDRDFKMAELQRRATTQVTLLQERRTALISAAVTGKIDVRSWKPPQGADDDKEVA